MESQLKARYNKLKTDREHYLERARDAAKLTLPSLIREDGDNETTEYETPWHDSQDHHGRMLLYHGRAPSWIFGPGP